MLLVGEARKRNQNRRSYGSRTCQCSVGRIAVQAVPARRLSQRRLHPSCEHGDSLNLDNLARRVIAPTLKALGITWTGFYSLRRGAGTITTMVARDRGLAAKGLLRHASLTTTAAHYIDSVPSETRAAVDEIARSFQNVPKEPLALSATSTKQS